MYNGMYKVKVDAVHFGHHNDTASIDEMGAASTPRGFVLSLFCFLTEIPETPTIQSHP